jgi:anti-sigma B factor antagonist
MNEEFKSEIIDEICVIQGPRRLSTDNSDYLKKMLHDFIEKNVYKIILDLKQTVYVDSSGLGAIVSTISVTRANDGDIRLVNVAKTITELLEITHLNKVLKCYESVKEGLQSFSNA